MSTQGFNITAVERDTGLSKDVLRMWERRYGFPTPERDANGERVYPFVQVERLRLVKRLIDKGFRPGKLLAASDEELHSLSQDSGSTAPIAQFLDSNPLIEQLATGDLAGLRAHLQQLIMRQGLQSFVLDTAHPLTIAVGEAWMRGHLRVHEEHAFTELLKSLLRQAMAGLPSNGHPTLLLTTVPEEEHALGLLMAEVLFTLEGARCISLGTRTPLLEIAHAVEHHHADCVALSFSSSFSPRQAQTQLSELRRLLPESIGLWIGGAGSERIQLPPGVTRSTGSDGATRLLSEWRVAHA